MNQPLAILLLLPACAAQFAIVGGGDFNVMSNGLQSCDAACVACGGTTKPSYDPTLVDSDSKVAALMIANGIIGPAFGATASDTVTWGCALPNLAFFTWWDGVSPFDTAAFPGGAAFCPCTTTAGCPDTVFPATVCSPELTFANSIGGDPHVKTPSGDEFDFKGEDGATYNLLSHRNVSINALFEHVDFYTPLGKLVHGSYMREFYLTVRTNTSDELHVEFAAKKAAMAAVSGRMIFNGQHIIQDNVEVLLKDRMLEVKTPEWIVRAHSKVNPKVVNATSCADGRCYLSVSISPLFDVDHTPVAPHGLLGQSYDGDGLGVIGAKDNYNQNEVTTSAMGEGAIEGLAADYKMSYKFATSFAFSRYDKLVAAPRDAATLTGVKKVVKQLPTSIAIKRAEVE